MADSRVQIPEVYVLWHPACTIGASLATAIYKWLRPGYGLGPEVMYRSSPAPGAPAGHLPLPLPFERRAHGPTGSVMPSRRLVDSQVVIPLIDAHMVADPRWRYWLAELADAGKGSTRRPLFVPVALDPTAYNIPPELAQLNFLRPAGLPTAAPAQPDEATGDVSSQTERSLLKQLTEALYAHFMGDLGQASDPGATKISVFLSHAKADGTTPARGLRDYIYSQTQLAAFYDENDIAFGALFAKTLDDKLESSRTAAMIVVRSAAYFERPWCRRELAMFRRPRKWLELNGVEHWRLHPVMVVDALQPGIRTRNIPELGNAPMMRWDEGADGMDEQIVTSLLRDALLANYHAALGRALPAAPGSVVLNWLPDVVTLLQIPALRNLEQEVQVYYPGRGLSGLELSLLENLFPLATFDSFDDVQG